MTLKLLARVLLCSFLKELDCRDIFGNSRRRLEIEVESCWDPVFESILYVNWENGWKQSTA